jgi:hypothetical protein
MQDSSIRAYHDLPVQTLKTQSDRICMLVETHWNLWKEALSLNEIKRLHKSMFGDIELSTIAARVNGLVAAKRLERLEKTRSCSVTGKTIHPVRPAEKLQ